MGEAPFNPFSRAIATAIEELAIASLRAANQSTNQPTMPGRKRRAGPSLGVGRFAEVTAGLVRRFGQPNIDLDALVGAGRHGAPLQVELMRATSKKQNAVTAGPRLFDRAHP